MKKKLIGIVSKLLLLTVLLGTVVFIGPQKAGALTVVGSSQHWPSLKVWSSVTGNQDNLTWNASHYDWAGQAPTPIDSWYNANPNITTDAYYGWIMIDLVNDPGGVPNWGSGAITQGWSWYNYCAHSANNCDWEDGFYHLANSDTDVNAKPSYGAYRTDQIRYILNNNNSNSVNAVDGGVNLTLTNPGETIAFGHLDKFDEINLDFSRLASVDWQGKWQYSTGQGSWADLNLISDTTSGGRQNGKVTFIPPSAWERTLVNNVPSLWSDLGVYYLKLTTVSGVGPTVSKVSKRGYWTPSSTGSMIFPAWAPANDKNGDGFVDDTEYANRANSNASARFKYESRIIDAAWSWSMFVTNLSNSLYRQKIPELAVSGFLAQQTINGKKYSGIMLDNAGYGTTMPVAVLGRVLEYPGLTADQTKTQWQTDWVKMLTTGKQILNANGYLLGGNVGDSSDDNLNAQMDFFNRQQAPNGGSRIAANPGYYANWEEYQWPANSPWQKWSDRGISTLMEWQINLYASMGDEGKGINLSQGSANVTSYSANTQWLETLEPGSIIHFGSSYGDQFLEVASIQDNTHLTLKDPWSHPNLTNQWHTAILSRDKFEGLAAFLTYQKLGTDYFSTWWSYLYNNYKTQFFNWTPAITVDYGVPTGVVPTGKSPRGTRGAYVYQTGKDQFIYDRYGGIIDQNYFVYARDYSKALVMFRPTTGGRGEAPEMMSGSVVNVTLPQPMYQVDYFGNVNPTPVTSILLRNAEGAIFLKNPPSGVMLSKAVDQISAQAGTTLTYTITYKNGVDPVTAAVINDPIPSGTTYVNGSASNSGTFDGTKIIWNIGDLATNASGTVNFQVKIL